MELFTIKKKSLSLCLGLILVATATVLPAQELPAGAAEGLQEARQLCQNMSESNRRLAKSFGYDVDQLCSSLELFDLPDNGNSDEQLVLPRGETAVASETAAEKIQLAQNKFLKQALESAEPDELRAFGYDLFAGEPVSFEPASRIPVSPNYILGPGDTVKVLFYGKINESHAMEINRDGSIDFPQLGPVSLAGMTFSDAKQLLQQRIKEEIIGIEASISLGELRSMQVFMLGEAYKPGTYTISALSTITNALFLSGGLSEIASLRNLQLKRAGKVVAQLDLYDLLLHGDTSNDAQLQSGDTIYITHSQAHRLG